MPRKPSCQCDTCPTCKKRLHAQQVRARQPQRIMGRPAESPTEFRGTFPKVRLRLTLDDVLRRKV